MTRILLALLVSGGLLALVLSGVDLDRATARLRTVDSGWLLASVGASFAVLWARGLRFRALTTQSSVVAVTASVAVQNFLVRVTPLRLGELSLPYLLRRATGEPPGPTLVSLLLVRLLELWVLVVVALASALAWFGDAAELRLGVTVGALALLGLALLRFRVWLRWGVLVARGVVAVTGLRDHPLVRRVFTQLDEALEESARVSGARRAALGVSTLAVVFLQLVLYGCLVRACGLELHPLQLVVGAAAAQIAGSLPVISVGNLGTHESGWTAGFVWVGLGVSDAVVTGIFTQVVTLAFAGLFAAPAWWWLRRRS